MSRKYIDVDVMPDGSVRIEPHGYTGPECEKETAEIERALGVVTERKRKPEYHQRQQQGAQQRTGR